MKVDVAVTIDRNKRFEVRLGNRSIRIEEFGVTREYREVEHPVMTTEQFIILASSLAEEIEAGRGSGYEAY